MGDPIYSKELRRLDYRLIFWLLSHQNVDKGMPTGVVKSGWRTLAQRDLKTHHRLLWESVKRLRAAGVIRSEPYQRNLRVDGSAFE